MSTTDTSESIHAQLVDKVWWPDPQVFRQSTAGDRLDRPTGTTHALLEVDMSGTPTEVVERLTGPNRRTACGQRVRDLGEGCNTRQRHLQIPNLDGHVMGGGVDCLACLKTALDVVSPPVVLDTPGFMARPAIGWYLACAGCGENLTALATDYRAWHDDNLDGVQNDIDAFDGDECPKCNVELGATDA